MPFKWKGQGFLSFRAVQPGLCCLRRSLVPNECNMANQNKCHIWNFRRTRLPGFRADLRGEVFDLLLPVFFAFCFTPFPSFPWLSSLLLLSFLSLCPLFASLFLCPFFPSLLGGLSSRAAIANGRVPPFSPIGLTVKSWLSSVVWTPSRREVVGAGGEAGSVGTWPCWLQRWPSLTCSHYCVFCVCKPHLANLLMFGSLMGTRSCIFLFLALTQSFYLHFTFVLLVPDSISKVCKSFLL